MARGRTWGAWTRVNRLAAVLLVLLTGCYVPDQFKAEIRIGSTGDFAMSYYGELIYAPLLADIQAGKLSTAVIEEKTAAIERDLKRDGGFKQVVRKGPARFEVRYERQGHLDQQDIATFVRRNAEILALRSRADGLITVRASAFSAADAQRMLDIGLAIKGEFRVTTDATVKSHNASTVRAFGPYQVYIWQLDSPMAPPPKLVLQRQTIGVAR